ncbi:hypothetical protein [Halorussus salinisoli]|uniref:hypothetical protein n=1 Tax=Halorussus salinisoli TaxID=2558242 RepID=UPI0010C21BA2|nr:hypothetical protein [Halorussus salinisoli]
MSEDTSDGAKKLLAASGLGLGIAGSGLAGDADERSAERALQQVPGSVLVFGYEYNPGLSFEVVNRLQQGTVDSVLGREVGETGPVVNDTADYNGYVIRYQPGQDAGEYAHVFVRNGSLGVGDRFSFGTDTTFFDAEVNLITAGLASGSGADEDGETTTETTTETDTTTTQEVVVNGTTTEDGGG